MENPLLSIQNVSKEYSGHKALQQVSFDIPKGSIFGLLGPNGAGKTTLIRILNQITQPDEGKVHFKGEQLKVEHVSKVGYLPEERGLYRKMTIKDQIIYFARLRNIPQSDAVKACKEWLTRFDLLPWQNKKVEELSKGMQQKVQFIVTVLHQPELIILDEPFTGFDPVNTGIILEEIKRLQQAGATILFSTHRMENVEQICDRIVMINKSKKVLEGSLADIKEANRTKTYRLICRSFEPPQDWVITQHHSLENHWEEYILDGTHFSNTQEWMPWLSNQTEIKSMEEIIPSMHEIFVQNINADVK